MTEDGARPIRELALLCAVLDRAVRDLFSINCAKENSKEAHIWFFISEAMSPFSFFWICEELDLCPDGVRKGLTKILDMDIQKSTTIFWENVVARFVINNPTATDNEVYHAQFTEAYEERRKQKRKLA